MLAANDKLEDGRLGDAEKVTVYLFPDGEQYEFLPDFKSDDYRKVEVKVCRTCGEVPYLEEACYNFLGTTYNATCECGTFPFLVAADKT